MRTFTSHITEFDIERNVVWRWSWCHSIELLLPSRTVPKSSKSDIAYKVKCKIKSNGGFHNCFPDSGILSYFWFNFCYNFVHHSPLIFKFDRVMRIWMPHLSKLAAIKSTDGKWLNRAVVENSENCVQEEFEFFPEITDT